MANPLYAWTFNDPFHYVFVTTTTSVSIMSNILLMLVTRTAEAKQIGTYRFLLGFFALCDIFTSIGHAVVQPYVHLTFAGFYFFPRKAGRELYGVPFDTISVLFFIATYYQTFLVLAFHFIYRYKTVTRNCPSDSLRGIQSSFKLRLSAAQWILVGATVNVLYIAAFVVNVAVGMTPTEDTREAVPAEVATIYGVDLTNERNGFTVMAVRRIDQATGAVQWCPPAIVAISICYALIGATASVIAFCIYNTHAALKSANNMLSTTTKKMHQQIFNALLIQTAVPCVFSYTPLAICLIWPFTGISLGAFGNVLFLTTAIFPSIDAFFVLFFIRKFRAAIIRIFRLPIKTESAIEPSGTELTTTIDQRAV